MLIVILQASSAYDVEDVTICISEHLLGGKNILATSELFYPFFASNVWIDGHISEVILQYRNLIFIINELHLVQSF